LLFCQVPVYHYNSCSDSLLFCQVPVYHFNSCSDSLLFCQVPVYHYNSCSDSLLICQVPVYHYNDNSALDARPLLARSSSVGPALPDLERRNREKYEVKLMGLERRFMPGKSGTLYLCVMSIASDVLAEQDDRVWTVQVSCDGVRAKKEMV
jgi:hypothetical protein